MTDNEGKFRPHLPKNRKETILVAGGIFGIFAVAAAARGMLHKDDEHLVQRHEPGVETDSRLRVLQQQAALLLPKSKKRDEKNLELNRMAALFAVKPHITVSEAKKLFVEGQPDLQYRNASHALVALTRGGFIHSIAKPESRYKHEIQADTDLYAYVEKRSDIYTDFHTFKAVWEEVLPATNGALAPLQAEHPITEE